MGLSKLIGSAEIYSDNRGFVQSLNTGDVERIDANSKDVDFWIQVWDEAMGTRSKISGFG